MMTEYATEILSELASATPADTHEGWKEVVVDKTGVPRQAGSSHPEGEAIKQIRTLAEQRLHFFSKAVMGRSYLTDHLHLPTADFLQRVPPFRKLLLMPRDHAKTSIVSHCLPPHILIQSAASNIYFPGLDGCESRILLGGSSAGRAEKNLKVISTAFTSNTMMRALWPHRCYDSEKHAKYEAPKWNAQEMTIPRAESWPDASVFAVGVGVEIAGARPNVMIKDDLIGREAANSEAMMRDAIDWHKASRALMDEYEKDMGIESLEFTIGTRWAVFDLYAFILDGDEEVGPDLSVEYKKRSILEPVIDSAGNQTGDLIPIWPERFPPERIDQLRSEFGSMFYLLYMNEASDPNLVDFDMNRVRQFELGGTTGSDIIFDIEERDTYLEERVKAKPEDVEEVKKPPSGLPLNAATWEMHFGKGRGEYMRLKYG
jgi:hypothetical protein